MNVCMKCNAESVFLCVEMLSAAAAKLHSSDREQHLRTLLRDLHGLRFRPSMNLSRLMPTPYYGLNMAEKLSHVKNHPSSRKQVQELVSCNYC
jgi:hypothetical protein